MMMIPMSKMAFFELAIDLSLENEGGYANDPNDPGGETNFGISSRAYPNEDIKNLTKEHAVYLYKRDYWYPLRLDSVRDQRLANNLFDFGIHHGVRGTAKKWQLVLAKWYGFLGKVDGIIGSATIDFTNEVLEGGGGIDLNAKLTQARVLYYTSSAKPVFLKNFVNRAIRYL
jgi:lysozyme family protein